jgi:hypothetical protein
MMQIPHDLYTDENGGSSGKKTLDFAGFQEKLLRRTKSQNTVVSYMTAVGKFEAFCHERLGKSLQDAVDDLVTERADVYEVFDKFVGFVAAQKDGGRQHRNAQHCTSAVIGTSTSTKTQCASISGRRR